MIATAQSGDEIANAAKMAAREESALRPQPGCGTRLAKTPLGFSYSTPQRNGRFPHPFRPFLGPQGLTLTRGLVIADLGIEPTIGGVKISGEAKKAQPRLKLDAADLGPDWDGAESWAVVEVTPTIDATGAATFTEETPVVVKHSARPTRSGALSGTHPLALILWESGRAVRAVAITMFHLRYYFQAAPADGVGGPKHFFI